MKRLTLLLACLALVVWEAVAQTVVTGTVVSQDNNEPVIGAAVRVVGNNNVGTVTDADGKFKLTVPTGSKTLRISYVGYATTEAAAKPGMKVVLSSDGNNLDEVVVTAMGLKRERKALGYAVQDLKSDDLNKGGTTSLASAIQGKLTGVDIRQSSGAPGASAQIVIRGARSFSGNNQPLYVVDGMPINTSADYDAGSRTNGVVGANYADRSIDINPEDIESINVLKGQAASALYGIRASNGVIVITTKRGSKATKKPVITVTTNLSAERVSRKFERQTTYAQGNSVNAYSPSSSMTWGPKISDLPNDATYGGNVDNKYTQQYGKHEGQYYNTKRAQAGLDGWTTPQTYDNVGDFLGTGFTENASINISQQLDNVNYSFSVNNSHQNGIIPSTGMDRWGARGLLDVNITKEWKMGFSANYNSTKITSAPGANSGIMNVVYSAPAEYDLKGIPNHVPGDESQQVLFRSNSFVNPYWWKDHNEYLQHTNRFFGNAYVEFTPNIGWEDFTLKFREQAGIDMYTSNYKDQLEYGYTSSSTGEITNYGKQHNVFNNLFTATLDGRFGGDKQWGIDVVLGTEFNEENVRDWEYFGNGFNFIGFPNISNATALTSIEYNTKYRTVGFFGSASLSYADQVYLTVTGRNDYVSNMPRGSRSFFYPSVSLGWEFTKLPLFQDQKVLSYGKLRASFAQVGQAGDYRTNFYYTPSYGSGFFSGTVLSYPLNGTSTFTPYYKVYDPDLKPQNTVNWEFGVDLNFLNNRIKFEYTYSLQNVTDQIFEVPVDGSMGYQYMITNAGKMRTHSHEFSINAAILQHKDYDLNLGINFTKINNKVIELAPGVESIMLGGFVEPQIRAQAGCTYPNIYGTAFKRNENGELLLLDGLPQGTGDSQDLGNCSPDFTMGFNLSGRYKRWSLTTTWSWQKGGKMYHGTNMVLNYFGATKESLDYHEGTMVVDGIDEATGQKNTVEVSKQDYYMAYYDVTESGIYDTSFFKLRDATLTYQVPRFWGIDLSVFGFARNVLIWAKMPNFDPESSQGNGNMSGYFERFSVPATSSFGGGLKLTF